MLNACLFASACYVLIAASTRPLSKRSDKDHELVPFESELHETSPRRCGLYGDGATFSIKESHLRRLRVKGSVDNDAIVTELAGNVVSNQNLPRIQQA